MAKIRCIDVSLKRVQALRQEVGSYALMWGTGFELDDMFLCCKFAEGDSRILQQKLCRDRLKALQKGGLGAALGSVLGDGGETLTALKLARALAPAGRDLNKLSAAMDEHWRDVYGLADKVADRIVRDGVKGEFCEPCVERLQPANAHFDPDWMSKL